MDTVEKLRTINYVCDTCKHCGILGLLCVDPRREKDEEDRFASCEYLRVRIRNIDTALNNTVYADEIKPMSADDFSNQINPSGKSMSDPSRVVHYTERRAEDDL